MSAITVITSTLNALPLLRHTAASILGQTYTHLQWIIVDGASTDGTVEWLEETIVKQKNCIYISEPDKGIYDALNKGLPHIQGKWVIFLGAGDTFIDARTIEKCIPLLSAATPDVTIAYGGVLWVTSVDDSSGYLCYERWRGLDGPWIAARPAMPSHQGVFHHSRLFRDGFSFDTRFRIAADSEIVLSELLAGKGMDLGLVVSRMLQGGTSTDRANRLRLIMESIRMNKKIGIFWTRPLLQISVLISNLLKHPFRVLYENNR